MQHEPQTIQICGNQNEQLNKGTIAVAEPSPKWVSKCTLHTTT